MDLSDLNGVTAIVSGGSTHEVRRLKDTLRANQTEAERILGVLASHHDVNVRGWVVSSAAELLGPRAAPVLKRLATDRDPDVKSEALRALSDLGAVDRATVSSAYLKMLNAKDWISVLEAIWQLTRLREPLALDRLEQLASNSEHPGVRLNARVAHHVLAGEADQVLRALAEDEPKFRPVWIKGALYLRSPNAMRALEAISKDDIHDSCRRHAQHSLEVARAGNPPLN
jgi:hypothetical protein